MSSEVPKDHSESQSFYKDVFEYVQKSVSLEELQFLLTEDKPWENFVTEADLSREEVDVLCEYLIKLQTDLSREDQDRVQKYQQEKERFLKEFPQVKQELKENIKKLRELADNVDKVHRDCTISHVVPSSTSIVSGALSILGVVLARFTAGLSLGLSASGIGLGAAAAVTGNSTMVVENVNLYSLVKDAQDVQEGAKTASAENMRQKAQELEKNLEKLTWIYESLQ
ncbi:apolipoprotein L3-like isoform X3 [Bos javanicus]|uniref:apolipoprotein L3-like isoform X3 n=1 Tax=Bos javanicus TaxID=9906 RepID=UPI002AA64D3B|nr:apolipoprotein L3-like isoform X3 [Bos javanicus]